MIYLLKNIQSLGSRTAAPAILVVGLTVPNLISLLFSPANKISGVDATPVAIPGHLFALHHVLLVIGLSALFATTALAAYRWTPARRILHAALLFNLLDLFYRV